MLNFGDWQNFAALDSETGANQNPHQSGVARLGRALDPTSYIVSAIGGQNAPQVHDIGERVADYSNAALSPVVKATMPIFEALSPEIKQINKLTGQTGQNFRNFVQNKPVDTAAILAGSFFGGAAAGGAAGGGSSLGSAAADAAATSAITPSLASGAAGGASSSGLGAGFGAGAANAITPTFASGVAPVSSTAGSLLGTGAADAITPALTSLGTESSGGLLSSAQPYINQLKEGYGQFSKYNDLRSSVQNFSDADAQQRGNPGYAAADNLARKLLEYNKPVTTAKKFKRFM
jgi:hypothetical protein